MKVRKCGGLNGLLRLVWRVGRRDRMPILLREFDAPKMRTRAEKFHADACALFGGVAEIDDAALLFFFSSGINENEFGAELERFIEIQQAPVGVDYDRLALGAEFSAFDVLSRRVDRYPREDAGAAALFRDLRFWHRHKYRAMGRKVSQLRLRLACPKEQFAKVVEIAASCVVCERYPAER